MIELNVILPPTKTLEKDKDIRVISYSRHKTCNYYLIEVAEEYFTILMLKYGKDCVWKR